MRSRPQNTLSTSGPENVLPSSSMRNLAFKTPSRSLKNGRVVQDENTIYGHPTPAGLTRRKKSNFVAFDTAIGALLQSHLKTEKMARVISKATALSEITNKTPFMKPQPPRMAAPATPSKSPEMLAVYNQASGTLSARRISSTRRKLKLPKSTDKSFQTPETGGNYWDVSDLSIEVSGFDEVYETAEDYDDDVEYGPPTAIDPKYDPPFEVPDYKEVGATLMSLFRQSTIPDDHFPTIEFDNTELLADLTKLEWEERLELPEISLENAFPFMVGSESQLSLASSSARLVRNVESRASGTSEAHQVMDRSKPKFSAGINLPVGIQKPPSFASPLPRKPVSNSGDATTSHPRILKLTNAVVQTTSPVTQPSNISGSHSRAITLSHSRVASTSRSGATNMSRSRTPRPLSKTHTRLYPLRVPEDQCLLATSEDQMLDEDFLFDI